MANKKVSSVLDVFPYPWSDPVAQELHVALVRIHPTVKAAVSLAERVNIEPALLNLQQPLFYVWGDILEAAARDGRTRSLVQLVSSLLGPSSPARTFINDLLENRTVWVAAEPLRQDGGLSFITGSDIVAEPEALLYRDDLTIPVGRVASLIATLGRLLALAPSVCRLAVEKDGMTAYGTGFRVGRNALLTNWHVLFTKTGTRATKVRADFGYEDDGGDGVLGPTSISCDPSTIVADRQDDWALVRVVGPISDIWPVVDLINIGSPSPGDSAYIIQHPLGGRKCIGFVRNQVTFFNDQVVHYLTDTQGGSSGSPVFDADGRLIALHRGGGKPQDVLGKPPLMKNEGILAKKVVVGIRNSGSNDVFG